MDLGYNDVQLANTSMSLNYSGYVSDLHPLLNTNDEFDNVTRFAPDRAYGDGTNNWNGSLHWDMYNWTFNNSLLDIDTISNDILATMIVKGIVLGILVTMTIVGNVLVLLAVFVNAHLRSTTHYFIANLAVADLLLGTFVLPFSASLEIVDRWVYGQLFCDIWAAMDVLCCTASIMSLCVISIDRYIGVTRPLQHSSIMSEKRAYLIIIMVWILSIAISLAPLLGWKEPPGPDPDLCEVTKQLGYVLFSVSCSFYIPLAIILVVYFRVYREALNQSRFLKTGVKTSKTDEASQITLRIHTGRPMKTQQVNHGPAKFPDGANNIKAAPSSGNNSAYQSSSSSEHSEGSGRKPITKMTLAGKIAKFKREKKAAKTLGIVVGVFILCWFPFFFVLPLESLCSSCYIPGWLFKIIFWLGYFNSMMNPIIYACSSREFKRAFIRILKCQWRRRPRVFLHESALPNPLNNITKSKPTGICALGKQIRNMARKRRHKQLIARTGKRPKTTMDMSSMLYMTSRSCRFEGDSPISSLRLLQDKQRQETMDTVVISDDESGAIHEESELDDDNDDDSHTSEQVDSKFTGANNNFVDQGANGKSHLLEIQAEISNHQDATSGNHDSGLHVASESIDDRSALEHCVNDCKTIPDIIIDDTDTNSCDAPQMKGPCDLIPRTTETSKACDNTSSSDADDILWL